MMLSPSLQAAELEALYADGCFVRERFVGEAAARSAREELDALAHRLQPGRMGRGGAHLVAGERDDTIAWLRDDDGGPGLSAVRTGFAALADALRVDAHVPVGTHEIQFARYAGAGARYARHRDAFAGGATPAAPVRRVTAILYLNPAWQPTDGGQLRLHLPSGTRDIAPRLDTLVVFLSERVEHEVLPAHAERWAVTAWYY